MKHLLVTVALLAGFAGCDGGAGTGAEDAPDGGAKLGDGGVVGLQDATPGYTASGVFAALGTNPCGTFYTDSNGLIAWAANGAWDHDTGCWITTAVIGLASSWVRPSGLTESATSGVCGLADVPFHGLHGEPTCGVTYAPGMVLIWNSTDPRYSYHGGPIGSTGVGSAGYICLPNDVPYVIPC